MTPRPTLQPTHFVSVAAAIVNDEGCVLAVRRRDNGEWEPPGGVLEPHETIEEGLVREVLEETGLLVEPEALTGVYKNMVRCIVALVFRCKVRSGILRTSEETTAFAWLTSEEVAAHMAEAFAIRVLDAIHGRKPEVRHHDGRRLLQA